MLTMENLDFGRGHGQNFDHLAMVKCWNFGHGHGKNFWPLTMTPWPRPNGQKKYGRLTPPPPPI